ncbi:MAG TPA: c-type cytochrome, partial [Pirellulaceae bacterium]|nr:c-type cytochrome [Pirellulaceae bacterium]
DGPKTKPINLSKATPEELVATLKNDNLLWRRHAQRLLVERRKTDVVPQLIALANDQSNDELGLNVGAIHALWTLHGLSALADSHSAATEVAVKALQHPAAGVRRTALQLLPRTEEFIAQISPLLKDKNGQVRLAAALALAESPASAAAAQSVLTALKDPQTLSDRWLLDALTAAAARHDVAFLQSLAKQGKDAPQQPAVLERVAIVAQHYARGGDGATTPQLVATLQQASPAVADTIVAGLMKGWPKQQAPKFDAAGDQALAALFTKLSPAGRASLISLADRWENKSLQKYTAEIADSFAAIVQDEQAKDADRVSAALQLVEFKRNDAAVPKLLLDLLTPRTGPELGRGIIEAIGKSETTDAGALVVAHVGSITPQVRPTAVRVLLSRSDWTLALLNGIDSGKLQFSDLALDQRQALAAHPDRKIAERAKKLLAAGGGLPNPDRQKVLDELLPLTKQQGDAVAGKVVFKAQCAKCHTHSGEGTKIGPDLTGMAVHPKHELLTHIIDPSRSVEGNFRVYTAATADGRVLTGLLASETKTAIELIDAEGKKQTLLREDLEELVASPKSLMPEGFEKQVKPDDIRNLLEFLTKRGKFVPIPLEKLATAITTKGMFYSADAGAERLIFDDWSPKTFEGVPFQLVDPKKESVPNGILLYGPTGYLPPKMPKSVTLPCNTSAKAIHFLGGVSGWGFPASDKGSISMIVRLHYADGKTEDHPLKNGEQFADYIRRVDVPGSKFAFSLRGQQLRYLTVLPERSEAIETIELVKGPDSSAPIMMAVTIETPQH